MTRKSSVAADERTRFGPEIGLPPSTGRFFKSTGNVDSSSRSVDAGVSLYPPVGVQRCRAAIFVSIQQSLVKAGLRLPSRAQPGSDARVPALHLLATYSPLPPSRFLPPSSFLLLLLARGLRSSFTCARHCKAAFMWW